MFKNIFLIATFLIPIFLCGQSAFSQCDMAFTKVEHLASFKISNDAFQDTLVSALKSKNFPLKKDQEITYVFILSKESQIEDFGIYSGHVSKEDILKKTILSLSNLWKPAIQNGYQVCAYVKLKLQFVNSKI